MSNEKGRGGSAEEIYIDSAKKLRTSLPKFVIFLGAAFLIWIFGTNILIPLGTNAFVWKIEASRIVNIIVIIAIIVLIFTSFKEIKNVADALSGFVVYYIGGEKNKVNKERIGKLKKTFRSLSTVIFVSLVFIMFKSILDAVHPALAGIIVIIISIWVILALYGLVMTMGGEIEEAAISFTERLEKQVKKRKIK